MDLMLKPGYQDPELIELINEKGPVPGLDELGDIHELRAILLETKKRLTEANAGADDPTCTEEDHNVPTRDRSSIIVRSYRGEQTTDKAPALIILHGGGWCLGGLDNEALLCRRWCEKFGGISFNVDYRLAPEHKFPTAVYDAYDALLWVKDNAASMGADLRAGFVVGGVSAGANLACVVSHMYRDDKHDPPLTGVYLSIPLVLIDEAVDDNVRNQLRSREENSNAPILGMGAINMLLGHYDPELKSPLMSPFIWPTGHKELPPTYFQIAGMDPLRDEGLLYDRTLREEGVQTRVDLYPGLPHAFWSWFPNAKFSKKQLQDTLSGFQWLLQQRAN